MGRKRENTERQKKKDNKWMEDEQKEEIKRQRRHFKRENVENIFGGKVKRWNRKSQTE